jgi:lysyl-tRNA synthetase class 2
VQFFRNGEIAPHHNPEFTMLEFYRAARATSADGGPEEQLVPAPRRSRGGPLLAYGGRSSGPPVERLTVRDALQSRTGSTCASWTTARKLRAAAEARLPFSRGRPLLRRRLQPALPTRTSHPRDGAPTFLVEYPASMASLARLKPDDPGVAERVELYAGGVELANGFSELTDAAEQRRRLAEEQELRRRLGKPVYPLDEEFLAAVGRMPPSAGVAVGLDRLLMLCLGARRIADVLLFPAREFFAPPDGGPR